MIPIVFNHDTSQLPVGKLDKDGKIKLIKPVTVEQLVNADLGYIVKSIDKNGCITEAELVEISLTIKDS